jgi:hypothetical protein
MRQAAPFRFLGALVGGWICARAALLFVGATPQASKAAPPPLVALANADPFPTPDPAATAWLALAGISRQSTRAAPSVVRQASRPPRPVLAAAGVGATMLPQSPSLPGAATDPPRTPGIGPASAISTPLPPRPNRWSGSAWLLARGDLGQPSLAPGGTLGGSQAGGRLMYRLDRHWSLSARAYVPLRRPAGAEIAAGLDWRPFASIPVSLLAERRQAIGSEGRSAFSITAYGGFSQALGSRFRIDGYAQAGFVGLRSRDAFVDGSLRAVAALGRFELGAGAWGGAQPGASRLDVGPSLSYRLPVARNNVRIEADWRFRIAGEALPTSGPAVVIATDF